MDKIYSKIKELNQARLDYFNEQVKILEDTALEYLADDKIASGNRYVTDKVKLRDLKCEWSCGALPSHILFRLSVDENYSSNDFEYLKQVMLDRKYNLTIIECKDYGYVFERSILLLNKEEDLRARAHVLAEEYCRDGCYDDYPNPSLAESIDIWDEVWDAFVAGYKTGTTENGVIWHDLRKEPGDLSKESEMVQDENGELFYYFRGHFYYFNDSISDHKPIAWCEIPKFEEETK